MRHVRKGDTVQVMAGRERGKRGKVLRIDVSESRVVIEKVNLVKRHQRPTQRKPYGGIVEKEAGVHLSSVRVVCPKCDKPRRVGSKMDGARRTRVCRKCGVTIEAAA